MYSEKVKTLTLDKANIIFGITLSSRMDIEISLNYLIYDWLVYMDLTMVVQDTLCKKTNSIELNLS